MASFYEFFAGGGMARAGLGEGWTCLFANDVDARKGRAYEDNWGQGGELRVGDVGQVTASDLPGQADLAWGSFPCQDLSVAGNGAGLGGERSGTFHQFWRVVSGLVADGRPPRMVAVENVCGALASHGGKDFQAICRTFAEAGYRFGAMVINADLFVPQSRPRLFVVGVHDDVEVDGALLSPGPAGPFHTPALDRAIKGLPLEVSGRLVWWNLPVPVRRNSTLVDMIDEEPAGVAWHAPAETRKLLSMMSPVNRAKVDKARQAGGRVAGTLYRRTRLDAGGRKVQRAEVRFDDVAGCLRTPGGGSSRQVLVVVEGGRIRTRLMSAREAARLMGLAETYQLPGNYNQAYHLAGDGVVVPVVRHLALHLFEPVAGAAPRIG